MVWGRSPAGVRAVLLAAPADGGLTVVPWKVEPPRNPGRSTSSAVPATPTSTTDSPPRHSRNSHWRASCIERCMRGSVGGHAEKDLENQTPRRVAHPIHHGKKLPGLRTIQGTRAARTTRRLSRGWRDHRPRGLSWARVRLAVGRCTLGFDRLIPRTELLA